MFSDNGGPDRATQLSDMLNDSERRRKQIDDEWRAWVQLVFLDGGTPTGDNKDLRARACARVVTVGNAQDLARRLRERASFDPPENAGSTFGPDVPEITYRELREITVLLREAADALDPPTGGSHDQGTDRRVAR